MNPHVECSHTETICTLRSRKVSSRRLAGCVLGLAAMVVLAGPPARAEPPLATSRVIPRQLVSSAIPSNGDLNPYGIAFAPPDVATGGNLQPFDVLVSNFNASGNLQGTGSTIVQLRPSEGVSADTTATVFYTAASPVGLTLALGVLKAGIVVVGALRTTDGTSATATGGPLYFIDSKGALITSYSTNLHGPWGLALLDKGSSAAIFVSNVLNGTVSRIEVSIPNGETVKVVSNTQIAAGYKWRGDPAALEIGPAGLAYDHMADVLYVAATEDNAIFAVSHASTIGPSSSTGVKVFANTHLRGPVGLALASNGDLLTSNGDAINANAAEPSEIIEFTKTGRYVGQYNVAENAGGAFGLAVSRGQTNNLAVVNDVGNTIIVTPLPQ